MIVSTQILVKYPSLKRLLYFTGYIKCCGLTAVTSNIFKYTFLIEALIKPALEKERLMFQTVKIAIPTTPSAF